MSTASLLIREERKQPEIPLFQQQRFNGHRADQFLFQTSSAAIKLKNQGWPSTRCEEEKHAQEEAFGPIPVVQFPRKGVDRLDYMSRTLMNTDKVCIQKERAEMEVKCTRHPEQKNSSGVCPFCLTEKLSHLSVASPATTVASPTHSSSSGEKSSPSDSSSSVPSPGTTTTTSNKSRCLPASMFGMKKQGNGKKGKEKKTKEKHCRMWNNRKNGKKLQI